MRKPILTVVDDQLQDLEMIRSELSKRYSTDYEIIAESSPAAALARLQELHATDAQVIALLAGCNMAEMPGIAYLDRAHDFYPHARRVLLIPWGNRSATKPILHDISLGRADRYAMKSNRVPDEQFHRLITEILHEWQRHQHAQDVVVTVVGEQWAPRSYELRDLLERSGLPFRFLAADSDEGRAVLQRAGQSEGQLPVVVRFDGHVLVNPSDEEAANALGARHSSVEGVFDLAIIGAGPAGLSAAVYGASEGLRTIVIDRETIGGQAGTSSLIRNFLGFPFGISGAELTNRALDQAWSFGAETSVLRAISGLRTELCPEGDVRILECANGTQVASRAVILAMGANYQRLGIPNLEALVGAGVFYGGGITEAQAMVGQHVFVAGGGNSAGQAAVHLAKYAKQVTMLVRGSSLTASMSDYLIQAIASTENIDVRPRTQIVDGYGRQHLESLVLREVGAETTETVAAAALFVLIGAQPRTAWLPESIRCDSRGFILTGADLAANGDGGTGMAAASRPPLLLETSLPGVFAAGDVRHGSVKRVAAAVGEGGVAIQSVHQYLGLLK